MAKNILALVDFSELSNLVVEQAGELTKLYNAKCWLIHVAAPDPDFVGYEAGPQYIRDDRAETLREEHQKLTEFKKQLTDQGINCEKLLVQGQINTTIMSEIKKLGIDMVVMGSHGRSRLYDLLVGSVCEYMLRHSPAPLVVIPRINISKG
jgi:nucleotide-binding universal stress UspA family protein